MQNLLHSNKRRVANVVLASLFCPLIASATEPETQYNQTVCVGKQLFNTEIADTVEKMQKGMMHRTEIQENQAMLFVYPTPQKMSFWMKNTLIPLDMLFFDAGGILQEIKHDIPPCKTQTCPIYPSELANNQFVLEIKGGLSKQRGIQIGDKLYGCKL